MDADARFSSHRCPVVIKGSEVVVIKRSEAWKIPRVVLCYFLNLCINILPQSDQENVLPLTGTAFKPKPLLHQLLFIHDMI